MWRCTLLSLAAVMVATAADAADPLTVTITPSRLPAVLEAPSRTITVIDRRTIEERRPASLPELLRLVPGLHLDQPGGAGGRAFAYLRGGDPNFTLVLLDGIRLNDPTDPRGGGFDLGAIDLAAVERIEIVRGPLSSLYGSDAIAGAINIVTRRAAEREARLGAEAGADGYRRLQAEAGGSFAQGGARIAATLADSGEPVPGSRRELQAATANLDLELPRRTTLRLTGRAAWSQAESFPEDSGGPDFAVLRETEDRDDRDLLLGATAVRPLAPDWAMELRGSLRHRRAEQDSPGVAPGPRDPAGLPASRSTTRFAEQVLGTDLRFSWSDRLQASFGIEGRFEQADSDGSLDFGGVAVPTSFSDHRHTLAPLAETQLRLSPDLSLQAGLRLDLPSGESAVLSPHLGIVWKVAGTATRLTANYGQGFKLPSFFALSDPVVGNTDLNPERSESIDIGIVQPLFGRLVELSATLFAARIEDLVDFEEGPPPRLVNRSAVVAAGFEASLTLRPRQDLSLTGMLTFTDTDIRGTDEELRNRPRWRGGGSLAWHPNEAVTASVTATAVGEVLDSSIPTGDRRLDPWLRVDAALGFSLAPAWKVTAAIDNLFDAEYEEAVGFPAPGITPRLGLWVRF